MNNVTNLRSLGTNVILNTFPQGKETTSTHDVTRLIFASNDQTHSTTIRQSAVLYTTQILQALCLGRITA